MLQIYLDACCFNRPFDDQTQDRIRFEAESVIILLKFASTGKILLSGSDVLKHEISKIPDPIRKSQVLSLLNYVSTNYSLNSRIIEFSYKLGNYGFGSFDSLHIAIAELSGINLFVTTDDRILKLYRRNSGLLNIKIDNPVNVVRELLL